MNDEVVKYSELPLGRQISRRLLRHQWDPEATGNVRFWREPFNDHLPCSTTEDRKQTEQLPPMGWVIRW